MPLRSESRAESDGGNPPERSPSGAARQKRWPLAVAIVVCLALGVVLLERLSRPAEEAPEGGESGRQLREERSGVPPALLATVLARMGQAEKAREHREIFRKLNEEAKSQDERLRKGFRELEAGHVRQLVAQFYVTVGQIYARHSRTEQASKLWARATALDPENAQARQFLESPYRPQP